MSKIKNIAMILALSLCAMKATAQDNSAITIDSASSAVAMQAEIDHLYYFIGGARRCHLLTSNGKQDGMKTIVDFKRLHEQSADKIKSTEDFIAMGASNDATNGKANIMECRQDGEKVKTPLNEWLQTELDNYRAGA
jgi:hypothetical protein